MRVPRGILGAALLLWGWRNGMLGLAIPMALLVEAAALVPWRLDLDDRDFNRTSDVSALGLVLLLAWQFDGHGLSGIYAILAWIPVVGFALLAAQLYSTRDAVRYGALFLSVRRAEARGRLRDPGAIDLRPPYFAVTLVAATAGGARDPSLLAALAGLLGWWLLANRPRRSPLLLWAVMLGAGLALGYLGQRSVIGARRLIEPLVMAWIRERLWDLRDPFRSNTAIGEIGELKRSDRIVLRVRVPPGQPVPALLHEASYRTFSTSVWLAGGASFEPLPAGDEDGTWALGAAGQARYQVWVARTLRRGKGLLALPAGAVSVDHLPVAGLTANRLGAYQITEGPGVVEYRVHYAAGAASESPPDPQRDLAVPRALRPLLAGLAGELGLRERAAPAVLRGVAGYFAEGFEYSIEPRWRGRHRVTIEGFLTETRRGHCEYFATATVLLLRAAGVPARYATGYAITEYSPLEGAWLARRRHAHSWARAWVGGRWVDLDTTPAQWAPLEARAAPWWQDLYDLASWLRFRFERWRWAPSEEGGRGWYFWAAGGLFVVLVWRLAHSRRVARRASGRPQGARRSPCGPGADSEFYRIEAWLVARGHGREPGEPLGRWLARLRAEGVVADGETLERVLLAAHYRHRFHPRGLDARGRRRLREGVERWLAARHRVET